MPGRVQNQTDLSAVSRAVRGRDEKAYATYSTAWNKISTVSVRETVFLSGEVLRVILAEAKAMKRARVATQRDTR